MINRLGTFFMLFGGLMLLIFIFSTQAAYKNNILALLMGIALFAFGAFLKRRAPKEPRPPSNRFRVLRKRKKETVSEEKQC